MVYIREVLFRGKSIYGNDWVEGSLLVFPNTGRTKILQWNNADLDFDQIEVKPETICQYTGFNDKNGMKIFEGDIARTPYENRIEIGCIKYAETMCRFIFCNNGHLIFNIHNECRFEVIGNIYDNPELLDY